MPEKELKAWISGIIVGLRQAKDLFRESADAKGGCKLLSQGGECKCFLCLCDREIQKVVSSGMKGK